MLEKTDDLPGRPLPPWGRMCQGHREGGTSLKSPAVSEPLGDPLASLSVMVPVYQCMPRLPRHLESLQSFSERVHEIIWVITESPDGSDRMAREAATRLGGRVLEMPRGLYAAWNAGIAAATGEFLYISTVGDLISADGLTTLSKLLQKTGADVAVSPPVIYPASKKNHKRSAHWPVFRFADFLKPYAGTVIPRQQAMLMQILSGASGLTGSCASCLFRASVLKSRPFPVDHHHYGDTVWLYRHLHEISLAYWPEKLARFEIHDSEIRRIIDKSRTYDLMGRLGKFLPNTVSNWVDQLILACIKIDMIREPHPKYGWWIFPSAWKFRLQRNKVRSLLSEYLRFSTKQPSV